MTELKILLLLFKLPMNFFFSISSLKRKMKRKKHLLPQDQIFLPFLLRNRVSEMVNEGDLSISQKNKLIDAAKAFHLQALEYALDHFPMEDEFLSHARVLNFLDQKCSFSSCLWLANHLKSYIQFSPAVFRDGGRICAVSCD